MISESTLTSPIRVLCSSQLKPLELQRYAGFNTVAVLKLFLLNLCWTVVLFLFHGKN